MKDLEIVSAAAAVAVAAPADGGAAAAEEKTEFDVVLTDVGANKIQVIKAVREAKNFLNLIADYSAVSVAGASSAGASAVSSAASSAFVHASTPPLSTIA